jgi:hypothetical protein
MGRRTATSNNNNNNTLIYLFECFPRASSLQQVRTLSIYKKLIEFIIRTTDKPKTNQIKL